MLGRFIPEFDALTCLVQHEFYHRYTADVHTLNAIRELDQIFTGATRSRPEIPRRVLHETADPALVYLTLLLHDIGKAEGIQGPRATAGCDWPGRSSTRLGSRPRDRELVLFVIKNHLMMARFWQKRDVDDPQTATAFAESRAGRRTSTDLYVHHLLRRPRDLRPSLE